MTTLDTGRGGQTAARDGHDAAVEAETVALLQRLIAFRTVNPPGDELAAARFVAGTLGAEGIPAEVIETAPGRGCVVGRLAGDGSARPVLLLAHLDVVDVEAESWTCDPFAGVVRDGYLYGRGAIDDKGMLAANVMTMLLLKRRVIDAGGTLSRDVVLVATADEERGSAWGLGWLLEHRPELLEADFALNEGGRIRCDDEGRPQYVAVQTAEKVPHQIDVVARGPAGHASVPRSGNAVVRLGRALAAIGAHREPVRLTPSTRAFFGRLAAAWPEPALAAAMAELTGSDDPEVTRGAMTVIGGDPALDAVLRNGISPVYVAGGRPANVIPAEARASCDVRTLPGESIDGVAERLRAAIDDPDVEITIAGRGEDAPPSPFESPMFSALADAAAGLMPGVPIVPYMSTGATDNARLRRAGIPAYGLLPFPLAPEDERRMHGHDERVPLASLHVGVRLVYGAVHRVAVANSTEQA
ncbi:MAG TPA: M20/M25/M40 family metallo-hydrolase [Gemmatimonadales bacterium]